MKKIWFYAICCLFVISACGRSDVPRIRISSEEVRKIAHRVFMNECSGNDQNLLSWNVNEEFLSVGIGHFIWYSEGRRGPFQESFPELLQYLKSSGEKLPAWLTPKTPCPWNSRKEFLANRESMQARELLEFLIHTKVKQGDFLIRRLNAALPLMLQRSLAEERETIKHNFYQLSSTPAGVYALTDYANFKGLGILETEQYKGRGWGLLQVLSLMNEQDDPRAALKEFVVTADHLLTERVKNSRAERDEIKWLNGWRVRLRSYLAYQ